jgi:YVTN family beta-propeller protein
MFFPLLFQTDGEMFQIRRNTLRKRTWFIGFISLIQALAGVLMFSTILQTNIQASSPPLVISTILLTENGGVHPKGIAVNPSTDSIYIANYSTRNVSVIDGSTNIVIRSIDVGNAPQGIARNPSTNYIYVTNQVSSNVSVIDGSTNCVVATVSVGSLPNGVAVNPISNLIYVANQGSNTVSVIDGATNSVITTVNVGSQPVGIAVNSNTNRVYVANAGTSNNNVSVIDGSTNSVITTVNVGGAQAAIAVNPSTNRIYVTLNNSVLVIDGASSSVVSSVQVGSGSWSGWGIAVNSNTNFIYASNYSKSTVLVINGSTNSVVATVNVGGFPWGIAVNPNTNLIYVSNQGNNSVSVIDGSTNSVNATIIMGNAPWGVALNPNTNRIYVANEFSNNISVIDYFTNSLVATLSLGGTPEAVAVNPSTNRIYVTLNNTVSVIDGSTNSVINSIAVGNAPRGITVNPNTNQIYVSNQMSDTVSVIDGFSNYVVATVNVGSIPQGISVNPATNCIYVVNEFDNSVSVINGSTNSVVATVNVGGFPWGIAVNPNTNLIYVANQGSNTVSVIDDTTNSVISTVNVGSNPNGIAVNPSSNLVYVTNYYSNTVSVIDGSVNSVVATLNVGNLPCDVVVNPDTSLIYVANKFSYSISVIQDGIPVCPEISIAGNSTEIVNGDVTPSVSDYTDFGSTTVNDGIVDRTFTIKNIGDADLNLVGTPKVSLSGTNAADFSVITQPLSPVAVSDNTTFTVRFDPSGSGQRSATVSIANDDGDENPYTFAIQGSGIITYALIMAASPGGGGTATDLTAASPYVADATLSIQAVAGTGYHFVNWTATSGTFLDASLATATFTMPPSNATVTANFAINTYTINVSAGTHGSITPGTGSINDGDTPIYNITADAGYHIADVQVDNVSVGVVGSYTFTPIHAKHTISVSFATNTYTLTYTASPQGSITGSSPQTVDYGDNGTAVTALPTAGYHFVKWSDNSTTNPRIDTGVTANISVTANFAINAYTINVNSGLHGQITPGTGSVNYGDTPTYTISTDAGYHISDVQVDNVSVGAIGSYTFAPVHATHTINASFAINSPEIRIEGNSTEIVSGDVTPSTGDSTDFGSTAVAGGIVNKTYVIKNSGDAILTLSGTPKVSLSGANAADFSVTTQPLSPVASGDNTTFTVRFDPSANGLRNATISIANNDSDENPYTFAIQGTGLPPSITVTSPNGGENWEVGSNHNITWSTVGITGNVNVLISRNGGISWATIFSNTPNDGTQLWTVTGAATIQGIIKVVSVSSPSVSDISNANFSILQSITLTSPNGGENWAVGSTQSITWSSVGIAGNVNILISRSGGTSWTAILSNTPNDGTQTLILTGPATNLARVKVVSASSPTVFDISNTNFNIVQSLTVTSPNGGENWAVGSTQNITWSSVGVTGTVNILISRNGGTIWSTLVSNTPNDGSQPWKVTEPANAQSRIKIASVVTPTIFDTSNANFNIVQSIAVTAPNDGENWIVGSTQNITWTSIGITGNVKILVSRNGGTAWTTIISNTPNDGTQTWTVSGHATVKARIKVVSVSSPSVFDTSNANFSIVQSITVTSPNGGESWAIGSGQNITWSSVGIAGNVNILISRNGGTSWATIISNTPNDGTQSWVVSGTATTRAKLKVVSVSSPTVSDSSNAIFIMKVP